MTTPVTEWEIPSKVWLILLSWGLGVLMLAGLFSLWIWNDQREDSAERDRIQREQDRAMCALVSVLMTDPELVSGTGGESERSRAVRAGMAAYVDVLKCQEFSTEPPVKPRD